MPQYYRTQRYRKQCEKCDCKDYCINWTPPLSFTFFKTTAINIVVFSFHILACCYGDWSLSDTSWCVLRPTKTIKRKSCRKMHQLHRWAPAGHSVWKMEKSVKYKDMIKIAFKMAPYPSKVHFHKIVVLVKLYFFDLLMPCAPACSRLLLVM